MRIRTLLSALAPLALASGAVAGEGWYFGLEGGNNWIDDTSVVRVINAGPPFATEFGFDSGWAAFLTIGHKFSSRWRLELEGGFRSADLDTATVVVGDGVTYLGGEVVDIGSDVQMATAMVNFYYDFDLDQWLVPYIGAGAGAAQVEYDVSEPGLIFSGNDKAWIFAYQLMAGVSFPVADGFSMSLGYRYFATEEFDRTGTTGQVFKTDVTQHSIDVGMQFAL